MSDRWNSKWRSPPSWIYYFCLLWSNGLFPVTAVYISAKFHSSTSIAAELLLLVQKSKMAAAAILNYNLNYEVHLCTWNSHWNFVLIECVQYFWRYRNSKILRTWLKISIQTPQNHVFGEFWPTQTLFFYHWDPQMTLPYAETRVLSHKRSWLVFGVTCRREQECQKRSNTKSNGKCFP